MQPQLAHRLNGPINTTLITAPRKLSRPQSFVGSAATLRLPWLSAPNNPWSGPKPLRQAYPSVASLIHARRFWLRWREGRWQDYNLAATVPHVESSVITPTRAVVARSSSNSTDAPSVRCSPSSSRTRRRIATSRRSSESMVSRSRMRGAYARALALPLHRCDVLLLRRAASE